MNWLNTICILVVAFFAVFAEGAFGGVRRVLGAQIDLLPALMVYAALTSDLAGVGFLAFLGGLWFDSLSRNALGVSILPLFFIGLGIYLKREMILRDKAFAHLVLGAAASAAAPPLTLLVMLTTGHTPLLGWGTLWQWLVMTVGGALATPVWFWLFGWLRRALVHGADIPSSFRPDREIRRGR
jgi:hypothetical protein